MPAAPPTCEDEASKPSSLLPPAASSGASPSLPLARPPVEHGIDPRPVSSWYRSTTLPPTSQSRHIQPSPTTSYATSEYSPTLNTLPGVPPLRRSRQASSPGPLTTDTPPLSAQRVGISSLPGIENFGYQAVSRPPRPQGPPFGTAPGTGRWQWDMTRWVWVSYLRAGSQPHGHPAHSSPSHVGASQQVAAAHLGGPALAPPSQMPESWLPPTQQPANYPPNVRALAHGHLNIGPSEYFRSPGRAAQEQSGTVASSDQNQDARRAHQIMQLSGQPHPNAHSIPMQQQNIRREQSPTSPMPPPRARAAMSLDSSSMPPPPPPAAQQQPSLPHPQAPPIDPFDHRHSDFELRMHSFQTHNSPGSGTSPQAPSSFHLPSNLPQFGVLLPPNMAPPRVLPRVPTLRTQREEEGQRPMERRMSAQAHFDDVDREDDSRADEGEEPRGTREKEETEGIASSPFAT